MMLVLVSEIKHIAVIKNELYEMYFYGNLTEEELSETLAAEEEYFETATDYEMHPDRYNYSHFKEISEMLTYSGPHQPYSLLEVQPQHFFFDCTFRGEPCSYRCPYLIHSTHSGH